MDNRKKLEHRHKSAARQNLEEYAISRCKTILIGCLEEFETAFGFVWGHNQAYSTLTDEQKEMREVWAEARFEMLSKGQFRIDQLKDRMNSYDITNKTNYTFRLPQDEG